MNKHLCVSVALAVLSLTAAHATSFDQARALMLERSWSLKMSQAELSQKRYQVKQAQALNGPKVVLNSQYIEGSKEVNLALNNPVAPFGPVIGQTIGSALGSNPNVGPVLGQALGQQAGALLSQNELHLRYKDDLSGPRVTLEATWPLYTGGAISAKQAATRAAVDQAQADLEYSQDALEVQLVQKYFGVQLARSIQALRQDVFTQQQRDLTRAERFEKAGMIAKIERMAAQVNRDQGEREFLQSRADTQVAERELMNLLQEVNIGELKTPLFVVHDIKSSQYWQTIALSANPMVKSIDARRNQADQAVKAAKSQYHPHVYAYGQYNAVRHYLTIPEPDWIAGIGVKFTLWDNRDRSAQVGAARAQVLKAQAAQASVRDEVKKGVDIAWLRTQQALEQFDLTESSVALAQENLRLREKAFANGLNTVDDVNDARNKLVGAQVARRLAAYRFVLSYAMLHAASGQMNQLLGAMDRADVVKL